MSYEERNNNNPNFSNFESARSMIPMEQVREIVENRKCYNHKKGCKFQTRWHFCTCCLMLKAVGQDFFDLQDRLQQEDPQFAFSMTNWQRDEYDRLYGYWGRWCNNYPRGATNW